MCCVHTHAMNATINAYLHIHSFLVAQQNKANGTTNIRNKYSKAIPFLLFMVSSAMIHTIR